MPGDAPRCEEFSMLNRRSSLFSMLNRGPPFRPIRSPIPGPGGQGSPKAAARAASAATLSVPGRARAHTDLLH